MCADISFLFFSFSSFFYRNEKLVIAFCRLSVHDLPFHQSRIKQINSNIVLCVGNFLLSCRLIDGRNSHRILHLPQAFNLSQFSLSHSLPLSHSLSRSLGLCLASGKIQYFLQYFHDFRFFFFFSPFLQNTSPLWEDFTAKANKLHVCLR